MRVLMIMGDFRIGGAEIAALGLIRALSGRGCEFVVATARSKGPMKNAFVRAGAQVYDGIALWRYSPIGLLRIRRIVHRHDIDAVVCVDALRNGMMLAFVGSAFTGRRRLRICWCHGAPGLQTDDFVPALRRYRKMGLLDAVTCVSEFLRGELTARKLPGGIIDVIHNGVDLKRFENPAKTSLQLPAGKRIIVQVANYVPWKDPRTLLAAAGNLARKRRDFHVVLAGRDTNCPALARRVDELDLGDFVTLADTRQDIPSLLASADIVVLSTCCETFGIAVLEGMAAGRPVVASDVAALREVFDDGREGLKFPVGDAGALSDALDKLLDDAVLRARMSGEGRRRARQFDITRQAKLFHEFLLRQAELRKIADTSR